MLMIFFVFFLPGLFKKVKEMACCILMFFFFFNFYLAAPRPTLDDYREGSLTHPILITTFLHVRPESHREPRNKVGSLSPTKRLLGFEPGTFALCKMCPNTEFFLVRIFPHSDTFHAVPILITTL